VSRKIIKNFLKFLLTKPTSLYIIMGMKNEKDTKAKRPSKKVLMAEIQAKGVDATIVASLGRANIDTLVWVKSLLD
tara:strand:- start:74 stop:301 length:228 start_codon:yes stop_codon:yes gene_type:complete